MINSFKGKYYFLSNFYEIDVEYEGITYKNNEAAFQAQKCIDKKDRFKFCDLNASEAKHLGRKVNLRKDWENIKYNIMFDIVKAKFDQHPDLQEQLLLINDEMLIEGNDWNDRVWGCVQSENGNWLGSNLLGNILMQLRIDYQKENNKEEIERN